ncbi:MAG: inositol monophosphatase family protein [Candidatus Brocadiales bacterium]
MLLTKHLSNIFSGVMDALASPPGESHVEVGWNPKGHKQRGFDLQVEKVVHDYIEKNITETIALLSEESGETVLGKGSPKYRLVLDPVDGSDNFARGIPISGMAVAALPADAPLSVRNVEYAMVGDFTGGRCLLAQKGEGAFFRESRLSTSRTRDINSAFISCELSHYYVQAPIATLLSRAAGVRSFGCATAALRMVAEGWIDAHIDARDRLTAENFLAPYLLIREAGGVVTGMDGEELTEIADLQTGYSLLASSNMGLHEKILKLASDNF